MEEQQFSMKMFSAYLSPGNCILNRKECAKSLFKTQPGKRDPPVLSDRLLFSQIHKIIRLDGSA